MSRKCSATKEGIKIITRAPQNRDNLEEICLDLTFKPSNSEAASLLFQSTYFFHANLLQRDSKRVTTLKKKRQLGRCILLEFLRRARYERSADGEEANKEGDQSK